VEALARAVDRGDHAAADAYVWLTVYARAARKCGPHDYRWAPSVQPASYTSPNYADTVPSFVYHMMTIDRRFPTAAAADAAFAAAWSRVASRGDAAQREQLSLLIEDMNAIKGGA
jgi:hypothetical protein